MGLRETLFKLCLKPQVQMGASRGQVQPFSLAAMPTLIILSSREWKLITQSLPPLLSLSGAELIMVSMEPSSSFTAILIA